MKLDSNFQYGQKNAEGELRFIVYHDEERKPFQVSFSHSRPFIFLSSLLHGHSWWEKIPRILFNCSPSLSIDSLERHSDLPV